MNFGKWIVVAFIAFALFIGTLVTICVRQDISLVSKEYYLEELDYQSQIVRIQNTTALAEKPKISLTSDRKLRIGFAQLPGDGTVRLFRPSNANMDKAFKLEGKFENEYDVADLPTGHYLARMTWSMAGKEFFLEQDIFI